MAALSVVSNQNNFALQKVQTELTSEGIFVD